MENEINSMYQWPLDAASIVLRYFFLAGMGYFLFYRWKHETFSNIKIQKKFPPQTTVRNEILYSLATLAIFCATSWLVFQGYERGITTIYTDVARYGYAYFFISIIIMVALHDAYFYWTHRFMHMPKIFKWVHRVHHLSNNPTPWAAFSFHPLEALISIGIIPIIVFLIPCHPYALFAFLTYMMLINVIGHLGYEPLPKKFIDNKVGKWHNTSTNHNFHHQRSRYNFGLYFTFWDRIMNTYSDEK